MFKLSIKDRGGSWAKTFVNRLEGNFNRGLVAGINRTAQAAQTVAVRTIQKDVGASSQKAIRRDLNVKKAFVSKFDRKINTEARLQAKSTEKQRIPIYELGPRPKSVAYRPSSPGVSYGPSQKLIPKSFIARMQSGHVGVFGRLAGKIMMTSGRYRGQKRQPIDQKQGPSAALVFGRRKVRTPIAQVIDEHLKKEVDRALAHFVK